MYIGNDIVNPTLPIRTNLFVRMTEPLLGKGHMLFLYNCNTSQQQPARTTSLVSAHFQSYMQKCLIQNSHTLLHNEFFSQQCNSCLQVVIKWEFCVQ